MIGSYDGCTGEDSCVEIFIGSRGRARGTRGRVREVGETELFGDSVGDVDVWGVAVLHVAVHSSNDGIEDTVVPRDRDRLVRRSRVWKCLRDNLDGFASRVRNSQ
jgi:hypothetical protein